MFSGKWTCEKICGSGTFLGSRNISHLTFSRVARCFEGRSSPSTSAVRISWRWQTRPEAQTIKTRSMVVRLTSLRQNVLECYFIVLGLVKSLSKLHFRPDWCGINSAFHGCFEWSQVIAGTCDSVQTFDCIADRGLKIITKKLARSSMSHANSRSNEACSLAFLEQLEFLSVFNITHFPNTFRSAKHVRTSSWTTKPSEKSCQDFSPRSTAD